MRYLLIKNGIVVNAIEADANDIEHLIGYDDIIANANTAGPGWLYQDGIFTQPDPNSYKQPIFSLSQLSFLRKFTAEERIAIRTSIDPIIIDFLHLLNIAQDINLSDPDTVAGVNYLESIGLLDTGRATTILTPEYR